MKSRVSESTLLDMMSLKVRPGLGGFKSKAVEKVDVGFGAVSLVVLVWLGPDLAQAAVEPEMLSLSSALILLRC